MLVLLDPKGESCGVYVNRSRTWNKVVRYKGRSRGLLSIMA